MKRLSIIMVFIILISFLNSPLPLTSALGNQKKKKTIGVIMIPNIHYYEEIHRAFIDGLFSEGVTMDDVEIILQKPLPDRISLLNTARKFAALGVDVTVSYGTPAALAAIDVSEQSNGMPVAFAGVFDPYAVGISTENATGVSSRVSILDLLQKLKSISNFSRLGILYTATEKDTVLQLHEAKQFEERLNFKSVTFNIKRTDDALKIGGVDALLITTSCPVIYCLNTIIDIARRGNIPTASLISTEKERGVLLSIVANPDEQGRELARLVARLLKGERASSLPIVTPKKIDIITNLKEASNLGFRITQDIIQHSTEVIK